MADTFKSGSKGTGKKRRVSHGRELAAVTLAMVASISGLGGMMAASGASSQQAGAPTVSSASPTEPSAVKPNDQAPMAPVQTAPAPSATPSSGGTLSWSSSFQGQAPAVSQGS